MAYQYTRERDVRRAFWREHPQYDRRHKITDYSGNGKMYPTDVRCAFTDWLDSISKADQISHELAHRVTLSE